MAGSRIGYQATSRATASERVLGFGLLCLFLALAVLLVGACNSQLSPPPGIGAGGSGIDPESPAGQGGAPLGGATGFGRRSGPVCSQAFVCVNSCTLPPFSYTGSDCDVSGAQFCPAGWVPLSTCAPENCANDEVICCDDTTGTTSPPGCSSDGVFLDCPAGTHKSRLECVPAILGVADCSGLAFTSCNLLGQECDSLNSARCACDRDQSGAGGLTWYCPVLIP